MSRTEGVTPGSTDPWVLAADGKFAENIWFNRKRGVYNQLGHALRLAERIIYKKKAIGVHQYRHLPQNYQLCVLEIDLGSPGSRVYHNTIDSAEDAQAQIWANQARRHRGMVPLAKNMRVSCKRALSSFSFFTDKVYAISYITRGKKAKIFVGKPVAISRDGERLKFESMDGETHTFSVGYDASSRVVELG